jgi:DNA-binding response OmpR family regulator
MQMSEEIHDRETLLKDIRLLVVEDERDTRELLRYLLRHHGAQVTAADSVSAAIALFDEYRPDVVVADIGMPGNDGFALIAYVRSVNTTPVVAVTAYANPPARERGLTAGFNAYIEKPFDPEEVVTTIRKLYDERKSNPAA